jgi:dynactin-5
MPDSVVAPNSVVAPFSIMQGNPAKFVGELPESYQEICEEFCEDFYNKRFLPSLG